MQRISILPTGKKKSLGVHSRTVEFLNSPPFLEICKKTIPQFNNRIEAETKAVAVALSGGVDSLVLAFFMLAWSKARGIFTYFVHVDHQLREESSEQALTLQKQMNQLSLECDILKWNHPPLKTGIQAQARKARYELLTQYCLERDVKYLFLGHHLDDQIETVLMRLFRGSGLTGLKGISVFQPMRQLALVRPFLKIEKRILEEISAGIPLEPIVDPSNEKTDYTRVRLRKGLSNMVTSDEKKHFLTSLEKIKRVEKIAEHYKFLAFEDCVNLNSLGFAQLSIVKLKKHADEVQLRLISELLMIISGNADPIRMESLQRVHEFLLGDICSQQTLHGCIIELDANGEAWFYRECAKINKVVEFKTSSMIWDNRFKITKVEKIDNEDVFISPIKYLDLKRNNKLNIDFSGLPDKCIYTLPVIYTKSGIVSVPHLKFNPQLFTIAYLGTANMKV